MFYVGGEEQHSNYILYDLCTNGSVYSITR
jgi:hypothetical protein